MFEVLDLKTRDGSHVAYFRIPKAAIPFEAIVWGNRMFFRNTDGEYREGCPFWVTNWNECEVDGTPKLGGQSLHSRPDAG